MLLEPRKCNFCGQEYVPLSTRSKYCSKSCKNKAYNGSVMHDVTCPVCGTVVRTSNSKTKYCSKQCHSRSLRIYKPHKQCAICGIELTPETKEWKYRGTQGQLCDRCREQRKAQSKGFAVCIVCGKPFRSTLPRKTCSDECLHKLRGDANVFTGRKPLSIDEKIALVQQEWSFTPTPDNDEIYGNMINL